MNDFDSRWQACAERARQAPAREAQAPFGFATRVVAAGRRPPAPSPASAWERLALGSLAGVLALLAVCVLLEWPHFHNPNPLEPGVENAVAQLLWSL